MTTTKPQVIDITIYEESTDTLKYLVNVPAEQLFRYADTTHAIEIDFELDAVAPQSAWSSLIEKWVKANAEMLESFPDFCHLVSYQVTFDDWSKSALVTV
jgi:hypothetical protein